MFGNFSQESQHKKYWKIHSLILIFSVVLVALILCVGQILINQLSSKQKRDQQDILRREDALQKKIQVKILETGYRESRSGFQVSFIPVLIVEVTNISQGALTEIKLASYMKKKGAVICGGAYAIDVLRPGEMRTVAVTCSQSGGEKSSLRGLGLTRVEESISFELWLKAVDISLVVENGKIEPKIISFRFPG
jgi:hypothetical protein